MSTLAAQLARLPAELVELIVVHCGLEACIVLRHTPALRRLLGSACFKDSFGSHQEALSKVLENRWAAGLQMVLDSSRWPYLVDCTRQETQWDGMVVTPESIKNLWRMRSRMSCLAYNNIMAGGTPDDSGNALIEWCCSRSRSFAYRLARHFIRRDDGCGDSVDRLRAFCQQQLGIYHDDRDLAFRFMDHAARFGRLEMVRYFDSICPELAQRQSKPNLARVPSTALENAAQGGHLATTQYLFARYPADSSVSEAVIMALTQGQFALARWLYNQRPSPLRLFYVANHSAREYCAFIKELIERGHLVNEARHYLLMALAECASNQKAYDLLPAINGLKTARNLWICPPSDSTIWSIEYLEHIWPYIPSAHHAAMLERVAGFGRMDLVQYVWDKLPESRLPQAIAEAVFNGHIQVAQWIADRLGVPLSAGRMSAGALRRTARDGRLDIFQRLDEYCGIDCSAQVLSDAIRGGNLELVRLLHARCPDVLLPSDGVLDACERGNLAVLQWLHAKEPALRWPEKAMVVAAGRGHLDLVVWLHRATDVPCTAAAMDQAARGGYLEVVRFLHDYRDEGCTTDAMDGAAEAGHRDVLEWLRTHRSEGCTPDAMTRAAEHGLLTVVRWLYQHYPHTVTTDAMDRAAVQGWFDVVQLLHERGGAGCTTDAMDGSARRGNVDMMRWLHDNRSEGCTAGALLEAAQNGHTQVVLFLRTHYYNVCSAASLTQWPGYEQMWSAQ
ncbi:hypothetical protein RI367_006930 [Sorochytrium milnesiophthora]